MEIIDILHQRFYEFYRENGYFPNSLDSFFMDTQIELCWAYLNKPSNKEDLQIVCSIAITEAFGASKVENIPLVINQINKDKVNTDATVNLDSINEIALEVAGTWVDEFVNELYMSEEKTEENGYCDIYDEDVQSRANDISNSVMHYHT